MHTDNLCLMQVLGVSVLVVLCVRARRALSADACMCTMYCCVKLVLVLMCNNVTVVVDIQCMI